MNAYLFLGTIPIQLFRHKNIEIQIFVSFHPVQMDPTDVDPKTNEVGRSYQRSWSILPTLLTWSRVKSWYNNGYRVKCLPNRNKCNHQIIFDSVTVKLFYWINRYIRVDLDIWGSLSRTATTSFTEIVLTTSGWSDGPWFFPNLWPPGNTNP